MDIDGRRVKLQIWDTAGQASRLARLSRNQGGELYLITTRHVGCGAKLFASLQERFRSLTSNFFSRADGMVLTFDVADRTRSRLVQDKELPQEALI